MLAEVALLGGVEVHFSRPLIGTRSGADVNGGHRLDQGMAPSKGGGASRPIGLFGVEEEGVVEASDLAQGLGAEKQDRADHVVASCTKPAEAESLDARSPRCGEGPSHASGLS